MTLSPAMLDRIRQGWGDVPEIRLLLGENDRLRGALTRIAAHEDCGFLRSDCFEVMINSAQVALGEREP